MLKLLHRQSTSIIGAATIVGVLSFVSRIVGLIRDRILAGQFGAGDTLDVYYAAFKVPDLLFSLLVVGALSASFIPLFLSHWTKGKQEQAWMFTNNTLHLIAFVMIVVSMVLMFASEPLAGLIAPGFADYKQVQVAQFMRVMLVAQIVLALSVVFGSVLQSLKRFVLYSLSPILYNVGIIVGALLFVPMMGPIGLAWGVVFGAVLHFFVQIVGALDVGYRWKWVFRFRDRDTRTMLKLMGPRALGLAVSQLLFVVLAIIASTMDVGSVTVFQFAYNIQFFPVGIIGVAFAIAVFPTFSEQVEQDKIRSLIDTFASTAAQMMYLLLPMMILFLVVRAQIVRVVVGAGAFDWAATILTADTLAFFALTFIPQALVFLLARAFFALHDTITPLVAGLISSIVGVLVAFLLRDSFGVIALAIAYSSAAIVQSGLLWVSLRQRVGTLKESGLVQTAMKLVVAGLVGAVTMQGLKPFVVKILSLDTFIGVFLQGFIAGGAGLIVYVIFAKLLRVREQEVVFDAIKRKMFRKVLPQEPLSDS